MRGGSGGRADVFGLARARDDAPRSTSGDGKTSPRKKDEFGGNKRAGEGTHQATGVGARRATFLRMNLSCREVRVPWVRPADARLIASILVNDTPTQLSEGAPRLTGVALLPATGLRSRVVPRHPSSTCQAGSR